MIPLLQTKTADAAHTGIFASNTRPLSGWGLGTRLLLNWEWNVKMYLSGLTLSLVKARTLIDLCPSTALKLWFRVIDFADQNAVCVYTQLKYK